MGGTTISMTSFGQAVPLLSGVTYALEIRGQVVGTGGNYGGGGSGGFSYNAGGATAGGAGAAGVVYVREYYA